MNRLTDHYNHHNHHYHYDLECAILIHSGSRNSAIRMCLCNDFVNNHFCNEFQCHCEVQFYKKKGGRTPKPTTHLSKLYLILQISVNLGLFGADEFMRRKEKDKFSGKKRKLSITDIFVFLVMSECLYKKKVEINRT
jgi:hypothetical protein